VRLILVRHALPFRALPASVGENPPGAGPDPAAGGGADPAAAPRNGADPGLTELGHRQAARVVDALAGEPVTAIYSSPMRRARETADPLVTARGLAPVILPGLAEYDSGLSHYIPVHEMARLDPEAWQRMLAGQLPAEVDVAAFTDRVERAVALITEAHPGTATVACFAHAGTINVYLAALLGLSRPLTFPLDYTGITRVTVSRDGRRTVRTVNEFAHVADLLDPANAGVTTDPGA
jgi:2,3-bisphosphoglycerate-dependent phosphoglycerate mutase